MTKQKAFKKSGSIDAFKHEAMTQEEKAVFEEDTNNLINIINGKSSPFSESWGAAVNKIAIDRLALAGDEGDVKRSYELLDYAMDGLQTLLSIPADNLIALLEGNESKTQRSLVNAQIAGLKYLGRSLEKINDGEDPIEALNLNTNRKTRGRPTFKVQLEDHLQRRKERTFAAAVIIAYEQLQHVDEACLFVAEQNESTMKNREHTIRSWYYKHRDNILDIEVDCMRKQRPDLSGLSIKKPGQSGFQYFL